MSYNSTHTGAQIDAAIDAVENKQDKLISGTNIKTVNNTSVLGSGNIAISWGDISGKPTIPPRTYIPITEDMVTVTTDSTKGVAPYSTSYGYTNITVDLDKSLLVDGLKVSFIVDTKMVVASSTRNVRVRFGTDDVWHPVCGYGTSILAGSTYFVKDQTLDYMYRTTTYSYGAFHQEYDANANYYEALSSTAAATAAKTATGTYPFATLRDGLRIQCIWRYANTAKSSVTFNWNSLGAKPLYLNGSAISSSNYDIPIGVWPMYYDGTNWYLRTDGKHPNPKFFDDLTEIKAADNSAGAHASSNSMYINAGNSYIDVADSSIGVSTNSFKWNNKTILTEDYAPEITSIENDYCEIGMSGEEAYISVVGDDDSSADITVSVYDGVSVSTDDGLSFNWNGDRVATEADLAGKQDKITSSNKLAYSLISGTPTIPAAPGTLNTNNSTAQAASSSEALSGAIKLHKVSKTGSYNDLLNKPTIPTVDSSISSSSTNPVQNKVINTALNNKQDKLTSGTNIKTINGESVLGSGNIEIQGGGSSGTPACLATSSGTEQSFTSTYAIKLNKFTAINDVNTFQLSGDGVKCMQAGMYLLSASAYLQGGSSAGNTGCYICKNGTSTNNELMSVYSYAAANAYHSKNCSKIAYLNAGDVIYLVARGANGGKVQQNNAATHLSISYLGLAALPKITFDIEDIGMGQYYLCYADGSQEYIQLGNMTSRTTYSNVVYIQCDDSYGMSLAFDKAYTYDKAESYNGTRTTTTSSEWTTAGSSYMLLSGECLFPKGDMVITGNGW